MYTFDIENIIMGVDKLCAKKNKCIKLVITTWIMKYKNLMHLSTLWSIHVFFLFYSFNHSKMNWCLVFKTHLMTQLIKTSLSSFIERYSKIVKHTAIQIKFRENILFIYVAASQSRTSRAGFLGLWAIVQWRFS